MEAATPPSLSPEPDRVATLTTYNASRHIDSSARRALALGFGAITRSALLAGAVDQLLPLVSYPTFVAESLVTTVGFGIVLSPSFADQDGGRASRPARAVTRFALAPPPSVG